ncbi:type IV toxin-antitoxin system AbiEi family antitoxin domain-containing protein [bacterium]|nr:type IV toxin-antitoxin system AbiEi family antitoxin domain-containing protein [bacterium]
MHKNTWDKLSDLSEVGAFRICNAKKAGISPRTIQRLFEKGELLRISRGVYQLKDLHDMPSPDYAAIKQRVPNGVLCLVSALYHHELTMEIPRLIHLAVNRNSNVPRIDYPRIRVFRMSELQFNTGVIRKCISGVDLRIYNREKTIADCFKYRNLYGIDLAFEALKLYVNQPTSKLSSVLEMAKICRVESIIRPYLEFLS